MAESDKSRGVLLSSGYIAGGAIAGIIVAIVQVRGSWDHTLVEWATNHNPLFAGPWSDALSMLPFVALAVYLYRVGRGGMGNNVRPA